MDCRQLMVTFAPRGWDQTGSNAANLNWPDQFGVDTKSGASGTWILGLVNAAPYFASAFM